MLTRSGLGALLSAVVVLVFGTWWGYEELVVAAIGIGLVVLLALLIAQRPLRATVERRLRTIRVPRGDPILVTYRVRNDTDHRSARATLIDHCDAAEIEVTIDPVDAGNVADIPATIPTTRRGVFPIGPLDVQKIDPFHLAVGRWRDDRDTAAPTSVTVHPKIYDLSSPAGSSRVVENESILRRAATDPMSGFVSMREYVAGDDPRLIHWPTTARAGTLMIRENVEVRRSEFTVVIDAGPDAGSPAGFEEIVDVAATMSIHALRTGLDVVVRTTHPTCAGRPTPLRSEAEVLDLLTSVQLATEAAPLEVAALFAHGFDHTSVLVVTGPSGPTSRIGSNEQMVVIRIGEGAQSGGVVSVAAEDAPDFVNKWHSWGWPS